MTSLLGPEEAEALRKATRGRSLHAADQLSIQEALMLAWSILYSLEKNLPEAAKRSPEAAKRSGDGGA
jgi:hypothetical protein